MTVTARRAAIAALATATALGATVLTAPAYAVDAATTTTGGGQQQTQDLKKKDQKENPKELEVGTLQWGVKKSLRDDLAGTQGKINTADGAKRLGGSGEFTFAEGTSVKTAEAITTTFKGSVQFQGHKKADKSYALDVKLSGLKVVTDAAQGKAGKIMADVTNAGGKHEGVELAKLDDVTATAADGTYALKDISAKLTQAGADAFTYKDEKGAEVKPFKQDDALDRLSFKVKQPVQTPDPADGKTTDGATGGNGGATAGQTGGSDAGTTSGNTTGGDDKAKSVKLTDGNLDWGLSETFRKYIDSHNGKAEPTDGAKSFSGGYRFPKGKGTYIEKDKKLDATFDGVVRFTANGAGLDLKFSGLKVEVTGKTGKIIADVTSKTDNKAPAKKTVELAALTIDEDALKAKDGVVTLSAVPATLAKGGEDVFRYGQDDIVAKGATLDPVTISVAVDKNAKLPDVPSGNTSESGTTGGDTGTTTGGTTATNTTATTGGSTTGGAAANDTTANGSLAKTGADLPTGPILGGAAALIVGGGAAVFVARRRRAQQQG
ncbi:HtaA domain-containing protein [Streptomyces sp. UNOC14_S4]|uniref:HtaA domain-containing protein n=1 Tax=Streptomyces sp. UNOC14_S4 TaxID=2872340 RepID=UPI001E367790|nr:HtaA domain-containing protein [Streptomyces sp. UNOC14_S4]MCC3767557.1 HtaA domain-containing protein [Streptomyces sp. UNOC14_S4]